MLVVNIRSLELPRNSPRIRRALSTTTAAPRVQHRARHSHHATNQHRARSGRRRLLVHNGHVRSLPWVRRVAVANCGECRGACTALSDANDALFQCIWGVLVTVHTALFVDVKCGRRGVGRVRPGTRPLAFPSGSALGGRILPPRAARSGAPAGTAVNRPSTPSSRRAVCRRSDHGRSLPAVRSSRRRRVSSRNWSPPSVTLPGGIARVRAQPQLSFRGALWDWVLRWTRQVRPANPCIGPYRSASQVHST
jgi:hypothetical protein